MKNMNRGGFIKARTVRRMAIKLATTMIVIVSGSAEAWTRGSVIMHPDGVPQTLAGKVVAPYGLMKGIRDARAAYVEGEVLVRYRPFGTTNDRLNMVSRLGVQEVRHVSNYQLLQVRLPAGQSVEQAVRAFSADPQVEFVQPNYIYRLLAFPNDPLFGQQWGLRNTGQTVINADFATNNPGVAGSDMSLEQAWNEITDCSPVLVAVVDSGVNYRHQDLAANMWDGTGAGYPNHGYDFVDNDDDPIPADASGHGTHVAATIGAAGDNGIAGSGVCWNARIMAVRSLTDIGGTTASIVAGIDFALTHGARVINMSLGSTTFDAAFNDAITAALNAGVVVVVAAGNDGTNNDTGAAHYPCNFTQPNLLCVTALDQAYARASFGNIGATSVDVGAPGQNVLNAVAGPEAIEDFSTGWTLGGVWTRVNCVPLTGLSATSMLVNPANWCANGTYANNVSEVAYKTFDFSTVLGFQISFFSLVNLQQGADFMGVAYRGAGGDPFVNGSTPVEVSDPAALYQWVVSAPLSECGTATCSVGIRLRSDATVVGRGIGAFFATVGTAVANGNHTKVLSGTSMASPHVAGVAAMLLAYNPGFTYADAVDAIKSGGRDVASLAGVTTTGRAVDAMGALRYIRPPTGLSASVQ